jgi:ABC-type uncharacterized transport system permease subunit
VEIKIKTQVVVVEAVTLQLRHITKLFGWPVHQEQMVTALTQIEPQNVQLDFKPLVARVLQRMETVVV